MARIEVHDVVKAYADDGDYFIVGRVSCLDFSTREGVVAYGVTYEDRAGNLQEITVDADNVEVLNALSVPSVDVLEALFYAEYGEEFIS